MSADNQAVVANVGAARPAVDVEALAVDACSVGPPVQRPADWGGEPGGHMLRTGGVASITFTTFAARIQRAAAGDKRPGLMTLPWSSMRLAGGQAGARRCRLVLPTGCTCPGRSSRSVASGSDTTLGSWLADPAIHRVAPVTNWQRKATCCAAQRGPRVVAACSTAAPGSPNLPARQPAMATLPGMVTGLDTATGRGRRRGPGADGSTQKLLLMTGWLWWSKFPVQPWVWPGSGGGGNCGDAAKRMWPSLSSSPLLGDRVPVCAALVIAMDAARATLSALKPRDTGASSDSRTVGCPGSGQSAGQTRRHLCWQQPSLAKPATRRKFARSCVFQPIVDGISG